MCVLVFATASGCTSLNSRFDARADGSGASDGAEGGGSASESADGDTEASQGGETEASAGVGKGSTGEDSQGAGSQSDASQSDGGEAETRGGGSTSEDGSWTEGDGVFPPPESVTVYAVAVQDGSFGLRTDPFEEIAIQCALEATAAGVACEDGIPLLSSSGQAIDDLIFAFYEGTGMGEDEILDEAAQLPFLLPSGEEMGFSWLQFLYGPHQFPGPTEPYLATLGFLPGSDGTVWTGGTGEDCDGWESAYTEDFGGAGNLVDAFSMGAQKGWAWSIEQPCDLSAHVLCLCPS